MKENECPGNASQSGETDFRAGVTPHNADKVSGSAEVLFQGKILCVTNRNLCREKFLVQRIESIARASHGRIGGIILREKDLPETEYRELAGKVMEICKRYGVLCILHNYPDTAAALGAQAVHLPLPVLRRLRGKSLSVCRQNEGNSVSGVKRSFYDMTRTDELMAAGSSRAEHFGLPDVLSQFEVIGASCHSVEDALEAQALGCTYITAGHIFATGCKKGVPPRGLAFLREVCGSVSIPVYAIGGINEENYPLVLEAGAAGACIMSGLMCCENAEEFFRGLCTAADRGHHFLSL